MTRILVVDDDPQILRAMRIILRSRGYDVEVAADGASALHAATMHQPELVMLDLGLPDLDGVDVISRLRRWSSAPIVVLSGRAGSADKVAALDAGADDYVTKPFGLDELLARIRAVTRRVPPNATTGTVRIGKWEVDFVDRVVVAAETRHGQPVPHAGATPATTLRLTPTEWHLLEILARSPGRLVGQRHLLKEVWGPTYERETNYLRQYMTQLRRKLEDDPTRPVHLLTEPGMGYRLRIDDTDQ